MSWHTVAYTGSIGNTANTDLPAVADDVMTLFNGHFLLRDARKLLWAHANGAQLTRARFDSNTMRYYGNPFIRPVDVGATPANNTNIMFTWDWPFILPPGEEIAIQVTNAVAGPTRTNCFLALQKSMQPIGPGNYYAVRATSTTAAVANTWTTITFTMDQNFPTGAFAMLWSEVQSATGLYHRWIFDEQSDRPGFPMIATEANRLPYMFWLQEPGEMGRFVNSSLPRLQVFCTAADVAYVIYMYIQPLGRNISSIVPAGQPYLATQAP